MYEDYFDENHCVIDCNENEYTHAYIDLNRNSI